MVFWFVLLLGVPEGHNSQGLWSWLIFVFCLVLGFGVVVVVDAESTSCLLSFPFFVYRCKRSRVDDIFLGIMLIAKLEPYLGFLHSEQHGKPSLVCDF